MPRFTGAPRRATLALVAALSLSVAARADANTVGPLIAPDRLASVVEAVDVIDIRAPDRYAAGHVAGAVSAPYGAWRGPGDNPGRALSDGDLTAVITGAGLTPDRPVAIAFEGNSATDFGAAARVYWTLKSAGFTDLSVLNGGMAAWRDAGLPLATKAAAPAPATGSYSLAPDWFIDRAGVEAVIDGARPAVLVDARPADFFTGKTRHRLASWAGTLLGAVNSEHSLWFARGAEIAATPESVRAHVARLGLAPGVEMVSFCNTGHWAATNWFVLSEIGGYDGVKLYPESMVGWTAAFAPFTE